MTTDQYPDAAQEWVSKGFTMEAEVAWLENPMKKEGKIRGFTILSDEPEIMGGGNTAPPPLAYFTTAVGF